MPETGWIEEPKQDPVPQGTAAVNFMLSVRGDPREGRSLQRAFLRPRRQPAGMPPNRSSRMPMTASRGWSAGVTVPVS